MTCTELRRVAKWRDLWSVLRSLGCSWRRAVGSHVLITCRCGQCACSLSEHPGRDVPSGTIGRLRREVLRCPCLGDLPSEGEH